ncbi:hypothetical protein L210DRAFT_946818 [Boletus edulis BED1]|uniref:Uncharacterized protein n=1 Tax=Boletus edulis BED1 TaxID=1328754 RepID=A0AAD4GCI0_BOLED|nr:hypothetical protein L210DRAFT_946818 [Boletus edulis BED1]
MTNSAQLFIPFQTRPSLECIPDDVMLEILSQLPTLGDCPSHISFQEHLIPVIPSRMLVRTPTLRALSQTSRLLRSRCLAMAWRRIELCGADLQKPDVYDTISRATETAIRVLKACPYLLPLIQTVSFIPTSYQKAEIIPAFAACLATLPNLDTIQVIHVCSEDRIKTVIKNAFRGKRFPSVRRIFLPSSMHAIIKSCRNVEEVACVAGDGGKIIQSLAEGKCYRVRILKGICAPLTPLANLAPNLTHASVPMESDMTPLTSFPFLDTVEILINHLNAKKRRPLSQVAALDIEKAREILKGNRSQANKAVVLTKLNSIQGYRAYEFDVAEAYMTREIIKV